MVTSDAAAALGVAHLVGSLEIGKRADVIAVDLRAPHLQPWHDPVANLVYSARGSDVCAVFVDGQPLLLDRRPVRLDAERILADAAQAARALAPVALVNGLS
jgi:5-methylthioadenosine/S-adenosylhomocysteine deaminase